MKTAKTTEKKEAAAPRAQGSKPAEATSAKDAKKVPVTKKKLL